MADHIHRQMGYEIVTLRVRFLLDDIIKWFHSKTVNDDYFDTGEAADLMMVGYDAFDEDIEYEHDYGTDESIKVDRDDDIFVYTNGDFDVTVTKTRQMVGSKTQSADLEDVIHSWMVDVLNFGAKPRKVGWEDMTIMADLCNFNRRIVGFYPSQTSMEPILGMHTAKEGTWVEVEWITDDHEERRNQEQALRDTEQFNAGIQRGRDMVNQAIKAVEAADIVTGPSPHTN